MGKGDFAMLRTSKGIEFTSGNRKGRIEYDSANGKFVFKVAGTQVAATDPAKRLTIPALHGKVGATSGWVITAGTNIGIATCPASQTGSTLVIPLIGLEVGDVIRSIEVHGQVESAGNAVTLAATLRKYKEDAAAGGTDSEVIASANIAAAVTADTLLNATTGKITPAGTVTVAEDEVYYVLLTATTLGSTDIEIANIVINITRAQ